MQVVAVEEFGKVLKKQVQVQHMAVEEEQLIQIAEDLML